jgi:hypothetical protein
MCELRFNTTKNFMLLQGHSLGQTGIYVAKFMADTGHYCLALCKEPFYSPLLHTTKHTFTQ